MDNIEQLSSTIRRFVVDVNSIPSLKTFPEIDAMERQCLQELRAIEHIAANATYKDLYAIAQEARRNLRNAPAAPVEKPVEKSIHRTDVVTEVENSYKVEEPKPKKKTTRKKKTTKKSE